MKIVIASILAMVFSAVIVPIAKKIAEKKRLLDIPNERSSHRIPVPRVGGIGIVLGTSIVFWGVALGFDLPIHPETAGISILIFLGGIIGFIDDIRGIETGTRMTLYLLLSAGAVYLGSVVEYVQLPGLGTVSFAKPVAIILSILIIAWYTNLFNFMDGINGIAGGTGVVTLSALAVVFGKNGAESEMVLAVALAAACGGFLFYNFPTASVFMGDGGAIFIGLAAGTLSLRAVKMSFIGVNAVMLLMYPFLFDATFTLARRIMNREQFWAAHRTHIYQQLVGLGLSQPKVTSIYVSAAIVCAILGVLYQSLPNHIGTITEIVLILGSGIAAALVIRKKAIQKER